MFDLNSTPASAVLFKEVEYLGHIITPHRLKTNNKLIVAVKEYVPPKNVQEPQRFLGLASHYGQFVLHFAGLPTLYIS